MLATIFGGSAYYATSGNTLRSTVGNVPVGLFEADARTRTGGFTARAEVAFLFIGDTAALNAALRTPRSRAAGPRRCRSRRSRAAATSRRATIYLRLLAPGTEQA